MQPKIADSVKCLGVIFAQKGVIFSTVRIFVVLSGCNGHGVWRGDLSRWPTKGFVSLAEAKMSEPETTWNDAPDEHGVHHGTNRDGEPLAIFSVEVSTPVR